MPHVRILSFEKAGSTHMRMNYEIKKRNDFVTFASSPKNSSPQVIANIILRDVRRKENGYYE